MTKSVFKADISRFQSSIPLSYKGESLKQINDLRRSIQRFGLFSPIIVERVGATLSVVDGRKRLAALMGLVTAGIIPRGLVKVPYVITTNARKRSQPLNQEFLPLLSNRQKYQLLLRLIENGQSASEITETLYTSQHFVTKLASVSRLSRKLKQAFLGNTLSLSQAHAFSTLRNHKSQEKLFDLIGPFVDAPTIISALESGDPVVDCGDDNVIIMPSRGQPRFRQAYAA